MNNIQINSVYNNVRESDNLIDFYNSIQNANIYLDSENESLESLDSDSDSELFNDNDNSNNNNNPNYYHNLINSVAEIVHLDHIRRPININNGFINNEFNNISSQLDRIDILNNSSNLNVISNEQDILNQSFEENSYTTNISNERYKNKIKKLISIKTKKESDCTICMEKIEKNTSVYKISCNHEFHKQCLDKWLKEKFECPTCRSSI
jgi:hypothetical protein